MNNQIGPLFLQYMQQGASPMRAMTMAQVGGGMPQDPMKAAKAGILHSVLGEFFNKNPWETRGMPSADTMETGEAPANDMQIPMGGGLANNGINDIVQALLSAFINKKMS